MNPNANTRGFGASCVVVLGILAAGLPAQEEAAAKKTAQAPSKSVKTKTVEPKLATVTAESTSVRCFPSNLSPFYAAKFAKGDVVQVGAEVGEFRRVLLPLGVPGFVSKKFTTEPKDGMVSTSRTRVSFRYRPTPKNRAEAPVQLLAQGTELHCIGEVGDWWKVRLATASAYLPIKDIHVPAESTKEMRVAFAKLVDAHDAEWRGATARRAAHKAEVAAAAKRTARLDVLRGVFPNETIKPLKEQQLAALLTDVRKLVASYPKDKDGKPHADAQSAAFLASAIERQQVFVDAAVVLGTKDPKSPPPKVKIKETPKDALGSRLHTIGWLTHDTRAAGPSAYRLEKGGRVIAYVYCNNLRYDLSVFTGMEIGVRGERKQDAVVSYIDVGHIEVLGQPK